MTIVNITVENDADFYRVFQYQTISEVPINITGAEMVMCLRRLATDAAVLLRLGTDTGEIVLTDPTNGLFSIRIEQAVLERLALGEYVHSNIMQIAGGYKRSIWTGLFINNAGPSRGQFPT
jgi:hypothetical protein